MHRGLGTNPRPLNPTYSMSHVHLGRRFISRVIDRHATKWQTQPLGAVAASEKTDN